VILSLVGRRALAVGPVDPVGRLWFVAVGLSNRTATFLLYLYVAPLVALFPLMAVGLSYLLLRDEKLHSIGLLGILVSIAGLFFCCWEPEAWRKSGGIGARIPPMGLKRLGGRLRITFHERESRNGPRRLEASHVEAYRDHVPCRRRTLFDGDGRNGAVHFGGCPGEHHLRFAAAAAAL
jgi:hypothetical protein